VNQLSMENVQEIRGWPVYAQEGDTIGKVEEIFYDYETNRPEWIGVGTARVGKQRRGVEGANAPPAGGLALPQRRRAATFNPARSIRTFVPWLCEL
jgi:sporulation protein YlmC with PRC-barrel domain